MKKKTIFGLFVVLFIAMFFIAGCNNGEDSLNDNKGSSSGSVNDKYKDLKVGEKDFTYKAVFSVKSNLNGDLEETVEVIYQKGDSKRVDSSFFSTVSTSITKGNTMILCTDYNGWGCNEIPIEDDQKIDQSDAVDAIYDSLEVVSSGTKMIAGQNVNCYKSNLPGDPTITENCFTNDGILLYERYDYPDGTYTEDTATSFTREVSDADFLAPTTPPL